MDNVNLQLKDPSAIFSDSGQTLKFREVLSFPKTEKVRTALKTGVVRMLPPETVVAEVETTEIATEDVKPSKRK